MDKPTTTKAQQKAVQKYVKNNYDRIVLTLPKGERDKIKIRASGNNESVNAYISRLIKQDIGSTEAQIEEE